ncbi:futalosine hydrolase [Streptomyces armeniacus]|uniref:Futalosine hydrolase n=1 Tax=Streptomyces armeniacus TaxID=83291 RepID=A0A345XKZ3_9ACTN|nr:futalosine hydrolase [Streptomyces armeniacus]AXK32309.1 futalosine hydrolase [Streptomyces armeniacus]
MRVLTVTAVAAERDAVTRAVTDIAGRGAGEAKPVRLPGGLTAHRVRCAVATPGGERELVLDAVAAGVGVGAAAAGAATALTAADLAGTPYDLAVSAGIGGGFVRDVRDAHGEYDVRDARAVRDTPASGDPAPRLGGTAVASAVVAADLGAQTTEPGPGGFVPVTELGFGTVEHRPPAALVRAVAGATGGTTGPVLTVSTVTGTAERAAELAARHPGAVAEAMEGFGVAEAAYAHGVPVLELRTVSNAVGPRDRAAWRIPDALRALTTAVGKTVPVLTRWYEEQDGRAGAYGADGPDGDNEQGQAERA